MDVPVLLIEFEGVVADTAAARRAALVESLSVEGIAVEERHLALATGYATEDAVRRIRRAAGAPDDETAVELGRLRAERAFAARAGKGLPLAIDVRPALERLASHCRLSLVTRASGNSDFTTAAPSATGAGRPGFNSTRAGGAT